MMRMKDTDGAVIGRRVHVAVDRPMGSRHPTYPDLVYKVNYGFVPGVTGGDGEEQDAYVLGVTEPVECFDGVVIAVIKRLEDREEKWVVASEDADFSEEEILAAVAFQEQYFTVTLLRGERTGKKGYTTMKPIIGILGSVNDERKTNLVYAYVRAVSQAGAIPVILPNCDIEETVDDFCRLCDGFLFTGGGDVAPAYYGAEKLPTCGPIQPLRDQFDFQVFQKVFPTKKPILGICRGIQVINVALGGTLYQDLPSERPAGLAHQQAEEHNAHSHHVRIERDTPLHDLMGVERLRANSFHHQAIKALGRGLTVTALAEDGVIEAVTYEGDRYLRGYQWHPERLCGRDDYSHRIFQDFIGACERARKGEG